MSIVDENDDRLDPTELARELERKNKEIAVLRQWVADLQSGMFIHCGYCGHRYGPYGNTPVSKNALNAHVESCPEHPMSKLKQKLDRIKAAADEVANAYGVFEIVGMSGMPTKLKDWKGLHGAVIELQKAVDGE